MHKLKCYHVSYTQMNMQLLKYMQIEKKYDTSKDHISVSNRTSHAKEGSSGSSEDQQPQEEP